VGPAGQLLTAAFKAAPSRPGGTPAIGWRGQVQTSRRASATRRQTLVAIGGDLRPWPPPGRGDQREPTWTASWR
jgi:hypothetical protein